MSNSLLPHVVQQARLPCPSPSPRACSNSCPWSQWCHPTISSSVIPFSSCLQPFPASGSFLMSRLFASSGPSIGASASASVLPMNIQDWFPLGWTGWLSFLCKGLSRVFSNPTVQECQFFGIQPSYSPTHICTWLLCMSCTTSTRTWVKAHIRALTILTFVSKVMSLLFNMLSRFITDFLPRSNCLLILWLQIVTAAIKLKDNCSLEGNLW